MAFFTTKANKSKSLFKSSDAKLDKIKKDIIYPTVLKGQQQLRNHI